jgi:hypothetical protein
MSLKPAAYQNHQQKAKQQIKYVFVFLCDSTCPMKSLLLLFLLGGE